MRRLDDFITGMVAFAKDTESPKSYIIWAAISMISSALERRCYWRMGHEVIYPNQYIVIVGPAGLTRKNLPISLAKHFLKEAGCSIAASKITNERLIRSLAESVSEFADGTMIKTQNPLTIISPELSVFLRFQDMDLLALLTDLWGSDDDWSYETKHQGTDKITAPCLSLFGATAPDWLGRMLPQEAIGGGWTSRCLFVYEKKKGKIVADPNQHPINQELRDALYYDLSQIRMLVGEYSFSPEAMKAYSEWYVNYEEAIQSTGRFPIDDPKLFAYVSRRATHIRKICMAVRASRGDGFVVEIEDWNRALRYLLAIEKRMPETFAGIGTSKSALMLSEVREFISNRSKVRRSEVLNYFQRDIDFHTINQIQWMLEAQGHIKVSCDGGTDCWYEIIQSERRAVEPPSEA